MITLTYWQNSSVTVILSVHWRHSLHIPAKIVQSLRFYLYTGCIFLHDSIDVLESNPSHGDSIGTLEVQSA